MADRDCLVVIPAHMESSRFPGKPLAKCRDGMPLIWHTWKTVKDWQRADEVVVATDNQEIMAACINLGINATLTSEHPNGSERVFEVFNGRSTRPKWTINVQADQPGITPAHLDLLVSQPSWHIVTLVTPFASIEEQQSPHNVKVIVSNHRAFYFTRSSLPCAWKHVGVYAFHGTVPGMLSGSLRHEAADSQLAKAESLEQLAWMEVGFSIFTREVEGLPPAVNTPSDLEAYNATLPSVKTDQF